MSGESALLTCFLTGPSGAYASTASVVLGTAGTYSVLAGTGVVNTGETVLSGDLGVSPSIDISGFPPGIVNGATHAGDSQAAQAQTDLLTAYNNAAGRCAVTLGAGTTLHGQALSRGTVTLAANTITTPAAQGGALSISVPASAGSLGTTANTVSGGTISGLLGEVQVNDARSAAAGSSWIASVTSTAFTSTGEESIGAAQLSYTAGAIAKTGTAAYAANNPDTLTGVSAAVTVTAITGDNTARWNPSIHIDIPGSKVAATYSVVITHSVL